MSETKVKILDRTFKVMIPAEQIDQAVSRVAEQLNRDYSNTETTPVVVSVLSGAFMFLADISRKLTFNHEISFLKISSYSGTKSTGKIREELGLNTDIKGRDVIIIEDIVDTGISMHYLMDYLRGFSPKSVEACTLFFKPGNYRGTEEIKYRAMEIGNEFIVGYGLDYDQLGRNLKDIYVVCEE